MREKEPAAAGVGKARARMARRLGFRKSRDREGLALAEGPRVVLEALASPLEVRWVLVGSECAARRGVGRKVLEECRRRGVETELAPDREVRALASTESPQAVLACVRTVPPAPQTLARGRYLWPLGVAIPGNLGTLVRSAWCFGLDGVLIGPGTVDPWNAKALRASAGGVFHMPLARAPSEPACVPDDAKLLVADPEGEPVERVLREESMDSWILAVGHETGGLPARIARRARAIALPQAAGADSLNVAVAGSILLYLLTRRTG